MGGRFVPAARTLGEAWREGAVALRQAGVEEADANAELLLLYALGMGKAALLRDWREPFPESARETWGRSLERKAAGEPAQYIVGEQFFYGRAFRVSPAVLIPRPETELLAEAVLDIGRRLWPAADSAATGAPEPGLAADAEPEAREFERAGDEGPEAREFEGAGNEGPEARGFEGAGVCRQRAPVVVDIGTGSGALAVTLAAERPNWRVLATDLSPGALRTARDNADRLGVGNRVAFVRGDLLRPFLSDGDNGARADSGALDGDGPQALLSYRDNGVRADSGVLDGNGPQALPCEGDNGVRADSGVLDGNGQQALLSYRDNGVRADSGALDGDGLQALPSEGDNGERVDGEDVEAAGYAGLEIDILISNPPYIPSADLPGLQREVRDYEPRLALDGGGDGLRPYRKMAEQLGRLAALPRVIAWEVGIGQAADVADLLRRAADWQEVRLIKDYAGIDRHVIAIR